MHRIYLASIFCFFFYVSSLHLKADDYTQRREAFIDDALTNFNDDAITLQAFRGIPVDQGALDRILQEILEESTADFDIVKLIRILSLSNGEYDAQILPVLSQVPFWLTKGEDWREYWSENHLIMWTSSNWILHEKYGWEADATLRQRIVHYLHLKIDYGYYEFFSSVYAPYCLSGILNLADFSQDAEIKDLATQAAQRLLKDQLLTTNDKGVSYPAAGRNYDSKYQEPYGSNMSKILYLLTGFGEKTPGGSHASNFLASSSIPMDEVINSWTPNLNVSEKIGHTLSEGFQLNSGLTRMDRVVFQWSSGAYFHPDVAADTYWLVDSLELYNHFQFEQFAALFTLPFDLSTLASPIAQLIASISKSSVICGETVNIFRNKSVTLSSIQDFWKGRVGYQQWPWAATTGTIPVYTRSGEVSGNGRSNNSTLPYIKQVDNVALIMYRRNDDLPLFGYNNFDIALNWPAEDFDETRENGKWVLGREGNSYIAVRRHCDDSINGVQACHDQKGQTWAVIVGNEDMYGSFDDFENIIEQAKYEEKWFFDPSTFELVYYGRIQVDGKNIYYYWGGNDRLNPVQDNSAGADIQLYPNPAAGQFMINMSSFNGLPAEIKVRNMLGQEVYTKMINSMLGDIHLVETKDWPDGLYTVTITVNGESISKKIIISN